MLIVLGHVGTSRATYCQTLTFRCQRKREMVRTVRASAPGSDDGAWLAVPHLLTKGSAGVALFNLWSLWSSWT